MTGTTPFLTRTPEPPADVLSDLLASMHLSGTVLFRAEFREPWSVITPDAGALCRLLPVRAGHVIPFHLIAGGVCNIGMPEAEPVLLREGDAVLMPYGDSHTLCGNEIAAPVPVGRLLPQPPWTDIPVVGHGGTGARTSIICGFLQYDELLFHPILRHLPPLVHVRPVASPAGAWLASTIQRTAIEANQPAPGSRGMLSRFTELMFVEILRQHIQGLSAREVGWFAAYNDPVAGSALKCLHAAPFENWTVESLARRAGTSRTILADRFKYFLGQPPIQYLAHWRLQLAAQQLKSSRVPLKVISERSGYESEAAFSRAFKRYFGSPPGNWRRRQGPEGCR
jgi:AraC family transcriptional regulator, alkane utilization regulator